MMKRISSPPKRHRVPVSAEYEFAMGTSVGDCSAYDQVRITKLKFAYPNLDGRTPHALGRERATLTVFPVSSTFEVPNRGTGSQPPYVKCKNLIKQAVVQIGGAKPKRECKNPSLKIQMPLGEGRCGRDYRAKTITIEERHPAQETR